MKEREIYDALELSYEVYDNRIMVSLSDASRAIAKMLDIGEVLLGWDAFKMADNEVKALMHESIDYSSMTNSKFHGIITTVDHFQDHLDSISHEVTHLNLIWDMR